MKTFSKLFNASAFSAAVAVASWSIANQFALATDFFVAPNGHDNNSGTSAAPWLTLQHAADVVGPGARVIVRPGVYDGFYLDTSGEQGNPIEFRALPGVLINNENDTTPDGINLEGASHIIIDGFEVAGMQRTGVRTVGFPDDFAEFVTIRNVHAHGNGRWGILTGHVNDLLIENNRMAESVIEHGIYVSNSGDRPIVRNNIVWGNNRSGIQLNSDLSEGGDGIISQAVVSGNIIYDNGVDGGSALNFDGVQNSRVENNLLYNNHASGLSLYRIDGAQGAKNNVVVNNTIHQATDGRYALNIQNASTGNTVRNNILVSSNPGTGAIDISQNSLTGLTSDYNVVTPWFTTTGGPQISFDAWQDQTGQDANSQIGAPADLFVNAAGGNYQLLDGANAINAALLSAAPAVDLVGRSRPYGDDADAGALERILPGDYNADGIVNAADYAVWRNSQDQLVYFGARGDGNQDGQVTTVDYAFWKTHFGQSLDAGATPGALAHAPEPNGLILATFVLAILAIRLERK